MRKLRVIGWVLLIFAAGIVCGMFFQQQRLERQGWKPHGVSHTVQRLAQALHLTPEQQLEFEMIIEDARERVRSLHLDISPDLAQIQDESLGAVQEILTPKQYQQFLALQKTNKHHGA